MAKTFIGTFAMTMKTFTPITLASYNKTLSAIRTQRKAYVAAIQAAIEQAVFAQAATGKADFPNALIKSVNGHSPSDVKALTAYLLEFCDNIRRTTSADKEADNKTFLTKKGVQPLASAEERNEAGLAAIAELPDWVSWKKEKAETEKTVKAYDALKSFESLLTNATEKEIKAGQTPQVQALLSFAELIRAGKSLAVLRDEIRASTAAATKKAASKDAALTE